jgi:hypothetical protein
MRTLSRLLLAVAFAVGASAPAGAAVMTLKGSILGVSIGALPPITFTQNVSEIPITVSSGGGIFTEPASIFTGNIALPTALFTGVALIDGLTIANVANQTKVIVANHAAGPARPFIDRAGGGLGGSGVITGTSFVNVLSLFNLAVPLGVIGNTNTAFTAVTAGTLMVAVNGTGWTTGNITITGITTGNPAFTPNATPNVPEQINTVAFVGFDDRTAGHAGVIQLVSPFHIITNAAGNLPGLATQTLTFVPEPGTILLLCSGVATLGVCGWLRLRSKR